MRERIANKHNGLISDVLHTKYEYTYNTSE